MGRSIHEIHRVLDPNAVAELRALSAGNLPHRATVTVLPTTGTRVGGALVDKTPVVLVTDLRCRLTPASKRRQSVEVVTVDQAQAIEHWIFTTLAGTVLPNGAVAVVSGLSAGMAWTRTVKIAAPSNSRMFAISARYAAEDVTPGGR